MSAWPSLICATLTGRIATVLSELIDVNVRSVRALLHSRCSDGQSVVPCIDEQARVDELARPEPVRLIGKIRLELD